LKQCRFCGREIRRKDVGAMELAGTIGLTLTALLIAIESVAADLGHDDPDVQEAERFARNGAGMSRAMHDAAHGDYVMASQLQPHIQEWLDGAAEMVGEVKSQNPAGFEEAAERLGGGEGAGARARWMVDNVTWDASGRVLLPGRGNHSVSEGDNRAEAIRTEMIHRGERDGMEERAIDLMLRSESPHEHAKDSDAWDLGEQAATSFMQSEPGEEWLDELPAETGEREASVQMFVDLTLDPMGAANMFWATSDIADDPTRYWTFGAAYRSTMLTAARDAPPANLASPTAPTDPSIRPGRGGGPRASNATSHSTYRRITYKIGSEVETPAGNLVKVIDLEDDVEWISTDGGRVEPTSESKFVRLRIGYTNLGPPQSAAVIVDAFWLALDGGSEVSAIAETYSDDEFEARSEPIGEGEHSEALVYFETPKGARASHALFDTSHEDEEILIQWRAETEDQ
jgi:hypothetical protein